jgi:hypothetical protein
LGTIVVLDFHPECSCVSGDFATDATHAEDAKDFVLRVVAELGGSPPFGGAESSTGDVDVAEGAKHEEDGYVGYG